MVGVIYKITSPSGKVYVGQTKNYKQRMSGHKSKNSRCILARNAIQKYRDKMIYEKIEENVPNELLNERETFWIKKLNCMAPNGLNCDEGGGVDSEVSQFTKDNMSTAQRRRALKKNGYEGTVDEQPQGFYPRGVTVCGKREFLSDGPCKTREEAIEILNEYARDPEHFVKPEGSAKYEAKGSVYFDENVKKWQARGKGGKYLGVYETEEEAEEIREKYLKDPEHFVRPDNTKRKYGTGSVNFDKSKKKWQARGKGHKYIGLYETKEKAESELDKYNIAQKSN